MDETLSIRDLKGAWTYWGHIFAKLKVSQKAPTKKLIAKQNANIQFSHEAKGQGTLPLPCGHSEAPYTVKVDVIA